MKIVVLDGYTLNPGDLSWDAFHALGDVTVFERTAADDVVARALDAEAVITNKCRFTRAVIDALPKLKYLGILATGYNNVDLAYAAKKGIVVTNIPAYSTESVVQAAFGLILQCAGRIAAQTESVKRGDWETSSDFCYYPAALTELAGKTLGIVGFGKIGRRVAEVGKAFGMRIAAYNKGKSYEVPDVHYAKTLDELLGLADVLTLHCPLTAENEKMLNADAFAKMKQGATVINTARGPLIDEAALASALETGHIAAAGLDVLSAEPPTKENPLLRAKNAFITPHTAWATIEARTRLMQIAAENLTAFQKGSIINQVN